MGAVAPFEGLMKLRRFPERGKVPKDATSDSRAN